MNTYCGMLKRVGSHGGGGMITSGGAVGNVRVASEISVLEIGDTMLRGIRCTDDLFDLLDPGREACVFIFRHFFYKPVLLGVKYHDDGAKYTITFVQTIATCLQYVLLWPLLFAASGFMIGLAGGKDGGLMSNLAILWIVLGLGLSWLSAVLLFVSYMRMKAA